MGTVITVRGTGWTHQVYADGVEVEISQNYGNGQLTRLTSAKSGPPDASGVFSLEMTIPATAKPGLLSISPITGGPEITDALFIITGGGPPSGEVQTQPTVTLTPTEGPPGTVTTAEGHGFSPNQPVTVTQSGGPGVTGGGGTVQADQSGSIRMSFRIADQTLPGVITVTFTQSTNIVISQFRVTTKGGVAQPGQDNQGRPLPDQGAQPQSGSTPSISTTTSINYAGYAVFGLNALDPTTPKQQPFVSGTWQVPAVTCLPAVRSESSMWVGLGGDGPLEQVATTSNCDISGKVNYHAYYQMLGAPGGNLAQDIKNCEGKSCPVEAHDTMIGSVLYAGNGRYELNLRNATKGWHFTKTLTGSSDKIAWDSARWIVEAVSRGDIIQPSGELRTGKIFQVHDSFWSNRRPSSHKD